MSLRVISFATLLTIQIIQIILLYILLHSNALIILIFILFTKCFHKMDNKHIKYKAFPHFNANQKIY